MSSSGTSESPREVGSRRARMGPEELWAVLGSATTLRRFGRMTSEPKAFCAALMGDYTITGLTDAERGAFAGGNGEQNLHGPGFRLWTKHFGLSVFL